MAALTLHIVLSAATRHTQLRNRQGFWQRVATGPSLLHPPVQTRSILMRTYHIRVRSVLQQHVRGGAGAVTPYSMLGWSRRCHTTLDSTRLLKSGVLWLCSLEGLLAAGIAVQVRYLEFLRRTRLVSC
jgi:hypothetical protein